MPAKKSATPESNEESEILDEPITALEELIVQDAEPEENTIEELTGAFEAPVFEVPIGKLSLEPYQENWKAYKLGHPIFNNRNGEGVNPNVVYVAVMNPAIHETELDLADEVQLVWEAALMGNYEGGPLVFNESEALERFTKNRPTWTVFQMGAEFQF